MSAGLGADPSLLAVSPQVTVVNSAVGVITFHQARSYLPAKEHHCPLTGNKLYYLVTIGTQM